MLTYSSTVIHSFFQQVNVPQKYILPFLLSGVRCPRRLGCSDNYAKLYKLIKVATKILSWDRSDRRMPRPPAARSDQRRFFLSVFFPQLSQPIQPDPVDIGGCQVGQEVFRCLKFIFPTGYILLLIWYQFFTVSINKFKIQYCLF